MSESMLSIFGENMSVCLVLQLRTCMNNNILLEFIIILWVELDASVIVHRSKLLVLVAKGQGNRMKYDVGCPLLLSSHLHCVEKNGLFAIYSFHN